MIARMYQAKRPFASQFVPLRGLRYHVQTWGQPQANMPPLVMVHGWMDVAASWQFVVDAFAQERFIIAPDWRGYGKTEVPGCDNYWLPDYLADLDFLLDALCPGQQVDLVGHSLGGNVAMFYSGIRPERIRRLVNLEGFGMGPTKPSQAPGRYAKWMDELKSFHKGELALKPYDSADGVARRLMKTNPRLSQDKADWLARHWAAETAQADGSTAWNILGDAAHKIINANLYQVDEMLELYKRISAPTLAVEASEDSLSKWWGDRYTLAQYHERLKNVANVRIAKVNDAGHMLHHDQPRAVAELIEEFLAT